MKRIPIYCLWIVLMLLALNACKHKSGSSSDSTEPKPASSLAEFTSRLTGDDLISFHRYNYNNQNGWWRRDNVRGAKTQWTYNPDNESVDVYGGFSELNRDLDLPVRISDSDEVTLKYNAEGDSLMVENTTTHNLVRCLPLKSIPTDPIRFFKTIDEKRKASKIFSIQHTPLNNVVEIYFTSKDQFFYIPDSVITRQESGLPEEFADSLSRDAVQVIRTKDSMLTKNWYYHDGN